MNSINRQWHETHKMPKKPSLQDRIDWHSEHIKNCTCRTIPEKLQKEIDTIKNK